MVNDRQDPYGQQGEIYGYDEYGRPLYRPAPGQSGYDYDPYAAAQPPYDQRSGYDQRPPYEQQPGYGQGQEYGGGAYDQAPPPPPGYGAGPEAGYGGPGGPGYGTDPQAGYGDAPGPGYGNAPERGYGNAPEPGYGQGYGYDQGTGPQPPVPVPPGPPAGPGYGYDYGTGPQPPVPPGPAPAREHEGPGGGHPGYDRPGTDPRDAGMREPGARDTGPQPAVPRSATRQAPPPGVPPQRGAAEDREYHTEQFAFVEEENDDSEEVIDWLKFTESRTERREESKRRALGRRLLLVVALVLAVLGGVGYLWADGRLPFLPGSGAEEDGGVVAESRDVIILHLRETGGSTNSTVLLVANETAEESTTLLLPNELVISPDGGTTTLGQAVQEEGAASVRDAVGTLLGAEIKGTWRLDTPFLEVLVDLVGGVTVESDAEVPGEGDDPLVGEGEQTLDGQQAVAYAVHRAADEPQNAQLNRFGQVLAGVLAKLPSSADGATGVVENLAQIADPSLPEGELGASLAQHAAMAQGGAHTTTLLPVEEDGSISDEVAEELVTAVLGGAVSNADTSGTPRVALRDASGSESAAETARIALVNGGWTVVDTKTVEDTAEDSEVRYTVEPFRETALEVARTLGIPEENVTEADTPGNADVAVVIGEGYGDAEE